VIFPNPVCCAAYLPSQCASKDIVVSQLRNSLLSGVLWMWNVQTDCPMNGGANRHANHPVSTRS
jgi:hypothetical protein